MIQLKKLLSKNPFSTPLLMLPVLLILGGLTWAFIPATPTQPTSTQTSTQEKGQTSTEEKGPQIEWKTFEEVSKLNETEPRKVMVDIYTDWCGWCKVMDRNTFQHEDIIKYVNKKFYAIKFNGESKDSLQINDNVYKYVSGGRKGYHELAAILTKGRLSYPTIVFLDSDMTSLKAAPGYKKPQDMDKLLRYFGDNHYKTTPYNLFSKTFISRIKDEQ